MDNVRIGTFRKMVSVLGSEERATQLAGFLALRSSGSPNSPHSPHSAPTPPASIDDSWRKLLLHTRIYARLCEEIDFRSGGMIHYECNPSRETGLKIFYKQLGILQWGEPSYDSPDKDPPFFVFGEDTAEKREERLREWLIPKEDVPAPVPVEYTIRIQTGDGRVPFVVPVRPDTTVATLKEYIKGIVGTPVTLQRLFFPNLYTPRLPATATMSQLGITKDAIIYLRTSTIGDTG